MCICPADRLAGGGLDGTFDICRGKADRFCGQTGRVNRGQPGNSVQSRRGQILAEDGLAVGLIGGSAVGRARDRNRRRDRSCVSPYTDGFVHE